MKHKWCSPEINSGRPWWNCHACKSQTSPPCHQGCGMTRLLMLCRSLSPTSTKYVFARDNRRLR
jgi:hypothetical protein